ncbi:MAG: B12-binding domain-containing radical SAM protein, partial [Candidatus Aenigmatarchaeota archaeon]
MAFGSHVTFRPKDSLKEEGIDFLVMREPEYIIRDFVRKRRKGKNGKNVKGLAYRTKDSIKINPPYPFIKNLDEMPFPDRSPILNIEYFNPLVRKLPWTTLLTSRGCPGRCLFCSSPSFYGNALRMRSAESVLDELEEIEKLGYREVFFRDETFTSDPKRLKEICEGIKKRGIKLSWICNARIGNVNKDSMKLMKEAGCHMIKFGVESGSQKILDNINKMIKVDMTRLTFKWAHEVGMDLHAHMMLGCIGETKETIRQTINFLKEIEPTTVTCAAFTPYPGTKVFGIVEKKYPEVGDGSACDLSKLHTSGFYNDAFCDLSDKEVGEAVKRLYREFYFRPKYIFKRLASI